MTRTFFRTSDFADALLRAAELRNIAMKFPTLLGKDQHIPNYEHLVNDFEFSDKLVYPIIDFGKGESREAIYIH